MTIAQKQVELLIKDICLKNKDEECCGVITNKEVIECKNVSQNKFFHFAIHPNDFRGKNVIAYFHSHPIGNDGFSQEDILISERINLTSFVYELKTDKCYKYSPKGLSISLIGRPFVLGIFDCIELSKDYFRENLNINIPFKENKLIDSARLDLEFFNNFNKEDYLHEFTKYFTDANFKEVEDLKKNDIIITKPDIMQVACHCCVYLGGGKLLNQSINKKSEIKNVKRTIKNLKKSNFVYKIVRWKR